MLHGLLVAADGVLIIARFHVGEREIVQRIGPVRSAARGVAEGGDGLREIGLFEIRDAQRVVAVGLARIDADGLLEQIGRLAVLLVEQQAAALEEMNRGLRDKAIPGSGAWRLPCICDPASKSLFVCGD